MVSYADRVRAGVALLDEKVPGWHERIDLDRFAMNSCARCVLGQLFGGFVVGAFAVGLDMSGSDEVAAGFDLAWGEVGYRTLTRLWRYVIRQRQSLGGAR